MSYALTHSNKLLPLYHLMGKDYAHMISFKDYVLDIIFPRRCLGCNMLLGEETSSYVCRACLKTISFARGFACAFCKSPVRAGKTCVYCIKINHLDRLLVATSYENPLVEKILKSIKYRFVRSLTDNVADLMIGYLKKRAAAITKNGAVSVVPVPLHRRRLNWRGFNQAEIITGKIAGVFGWPTITDALKRVRNPKPQADIPDRLSRIKNAENLFRIYAHRKGIDWTGKTILLIDDISTTGSTLDDCARALKGAGAKEVIGFVFARNKLGSKN